MHRTDTKHDCRLTLLSLSYILAAGKQRCEQEIKKQEE
jgi:hypothetical protein